MCPYSLRAQFPTSCPSCHVFQTAPRVPQRPLCGLQGPPPPPPVLPAQNPDGRDDYTRCDPRKGVHGPHRDGRDTREQVQARVHNEQRRGRRAGGRVWSAYDGRAVGEWRRVCRLGLDGSGIGMGSVDGVAERCGQRGRRCGLVLYAGANPCILVTYSLQSRLDGFFSHIRLATETDSTHLGEGKLERAPTPCQMPQRYVGEWEEIKAVRGADVNAR